MWRYLTPFQVVYEPARRWITPAPIEAPEPSFEDTMAAWWSTKAAAAEILDIMI